MTPSSDSRILTHPRWLYPYGTDTGHRFPEGSIDEVLAFMRDNPRPRTEDVEYNFYRELGHHGQGLSSINGFLFWGYVIEDFPLWGGLPDTVAYYHQKYWNEWGVLEEENYFYFVKGPMRNESCQYPNPGKRFTLTQEQHRVQIIRRSMRDKFMRAARLLTLGSAIPSVPLPTDVLSLVGEFL